MEHVSSHKRLLFLLAMIVLLLLAAGYYYIVYPSHERIESLQSELSRNVALLDAAKQDSKEKGANKDIGEQYHTVPNDPSTDQVILDFYNAEKMSKSTVQEIAIDAETNPLQADDGTEDSLQNMQPLTFLLIVQSPDYTSIRSFIDSLEQSERVYVIKQLNLPGRDKNSKQPFEYKVKVTTFYHDSGINTE